MKHYFAFFLLFITTFAFSQTQVKFLSYNIYHGELPYTPGQPNLDSIARFIKMINPDFVALQEVDSATARSARFYGKRTDLVKELAAKTGMHGYFGKAMNYDGGGYGEGLLSKNELAAKTVILPTPAGGEPRSLIYATTTHNGQKLSIGGTHLCHQYTENRVAQAESISKLFTGLSAPAVVGGDYNFESTEASYQVMMKNWSDAAVLKGNPQNTYSVKKPEKRIDYAFLSKNSGWKVIDIKIFPVDYSDHLPVLFILELNK